MKNLIVIVGPTGVGKTAAAIAVAQHLGCHIINADSRQVFRGIPIGTAAPTPQEQALVPHHFVQFKELDEYYSVAQFETDVMALLPSLWQQGDYAVMSGGSMMYVDAVCKGIDYIPDISDEVRTAVKKQWQENGLEPLLAELERLDPIYYAQVDRLNPVRVIHAVEICRQAGVPYSSLRTGKAKQRPFNIIKVGLNIAVYITFDTSIHSTQLVTRRCSPGSTVLWTEPPLSSASRKTPESTPRNNCDGYNATPLSRGALPTNALSS